MNEYNLFIVDFFSSWQRWARCFTYIAALVLSGCTVGDEKDARLHNPQDNRVYSEKKTTKDEAASEAHKRDNEARDQQVMLSRCEKELDALKTISPENYQSRMAAFSQLMEAANQYGSIRGEADERTASTIDALYQYRTSRICAGISWILLKALSENGEGRK
ncbi:hypothetical protein ACRPH4_22615 (plasmid) [Pantoea allii]|uniref:hypothetical protein n=1 Tax=Pantoea allii TaxID=574096 RepID=UPI003D7A0D3A